MRKFLAIVVCKLGRFVGKLVGKGSSMPGKFALKICPDILRRVQLPPHIIAVTGSNGKTSTVEMIATVLRAQGKNVIYNAEGSNQVEGVTTLILTHATLGGKVNADVLLLESDERYAAHSFKYFHPTEFVITNLYRDQLTRNGHPESVFDAILPAIHPDTELILNGDDPLSSCFVIGHEKVKWFGLNRCATDTETPTGVYHDGAYCPVCHAPMEYEYVHYNHIGAYRCTSCGHARPDPDYAATELDLQNGKLILDGQFTVALAFRSIYNVYNILAAYAACRECGVEGAAIADTLSSYILKNGRMQTFTLGQHHGTLLTSKHENSIAYDTNLRYIASANEDCTVLIIVDAVSRKYFTSETSWLWDIDFDQLNVPHVKRVILSGMYRNDLAERFQLHRRPELGSHSRHPGRGSRHQGGSGSEDVVCGHLLLRPGQAAESAGREKGGLSHGNQNSALLSRSHELVWQLCQRVHSEADVGGNGQYRHCGAGGAWRRRRSDPCGLCLHGRRYRAGAEGGSPVFFQAEGRRKSGGGRRRDHAVRRELHGAAGQDHHR